MKATVIKEYTDRLTGKVRRIGDVIDESSERLDELAEKGLVAPVQAKTRKTLKED